MPCQSQCYDSSYVFCSVVFCSGEVVCPDVCLLLHPLCLSLPNHLALHVPPLLILGGDTPREKVTRTLEGGV